MVNGRTGATCPRCGRRTELVIERNVERPAISRIAYMQICGCGWRNVSEIYIIKRDGSIVLARARGVTQTS